MTVNYRGILTLEILGFFTRVIYHKNYSNSFITLALGSRNWPNFTLFSLIGELIEVCAVLLIED